MTPSTKKPQAISLQSRQDKSEDALVLVFEGRLDTSSTADVWDPAVDEVRESNRTRLVLDVAGIDYCNGSGIGLLVELMWLQQRRGGEAEIRGLREPFQDLLEPFDPTLFKETRAPRARPSSIPEEIGRSTVHLFHDLKDMILYVGELTAALGYAIRHPRGVRWKDTWLTAEKAGANAFPLIILIGFLIGLIMAFQSAVPMKQFAAEMFVADLVSLSMLRELGPLMTAIILAGRSGSAFAAEIGTMKVNEEINALTTLGLDPVRFLVVTRVIAAVLMTPILAVFADLAGLIGGAVVLLSFDYPLVTYVNRAFNAVVLSDLLGGLAKAVVFGILIAAVGCMRGLRTGSGPRAVGDSTTSAVVSAIVLIAVTDGIFSVVYYYLGI